MTLHQIALCLLLCSSGCSASSSSSSRASGGGSSGVGGASNLNVSPGACPDAAAASPADAGACVSVKTRSFTRDVVPLFNSCAGEVCHSFAAGAIIQQLGIPSVECCGQEQMIEPGHPERSYVLRKLLGTNLCGGLKMPLERVPFSADDLQIVSDWICQGAGTTP